MNERKNIVIRVTPELHKEVKIYAAGKEMTIQDYVISLIRKDLEKKEG